MFEKATRQGKYIKLAITGPAGSGKTYSALRLAKGLSRNGKVAFIDTENGSASLYASDFDFEVASVEPPFSIDKLITPVKYALKNNYEVLIIDSASHLRNGALDYKHQLEKRGGKSITNWTDANTTYDRSKTAIHFSKNH